MDKAEHGKCLKGAMATAGMSRQDIAELVGRRVRTVTNWTSGASMPSVSEQAILVRVLGNYTDDGDPVESALRASGLDKWRADTVIAEYERHRHEQAREAAG